MGLFPFLSVVMLPPLLVVVLFTTPTQGALSVNHYHNYTALKALFLDLEAKYPEICKLHSIGQSVEKRELWVLQVSSGVRGQRSLGKPMFKYVANMHGNEAVSTFQFTANELPT